MRVIALLVVVSAGAGAAERPRIEWKELQAGVSYATIRIAEKPDYGDGLLHVVRVDPAVAPIRAHATSLDRAEAKTAAEWAKGKNLSVVINAGMFDVVDHRTHSGYFRIGDHTNSSRWVKSYKSALLVSRADQAPSARLIDLDGDEVPELSESGVVAQNLRLIKAPGSNVWVENGKQWSEAAIAMTSGGDILFVFSRTPFTMHEFNAKLLALGMGVVSAMHAEGGPEASLSIHAGGVDLDLCGSYETGFMANDENHQQWPIPNVIGVERARAKKTGR
ncbi:MAG TPA: phosphodiester glycosidase family protein [Myxococcaceae bacterium]|nr:phosphodiester glycosidase family protein [Myxococcaceae bacterium]